MQKHPDLMYIDTDPFQGDESELTCRTVTIRTARKEHICFDIHGRSDHTIKPGERYRFERARVDGDFWGEYKICLKCMDKMISDDFPEDY